jgi:TRAP-type C4-dicarboxylate transport system permease small subunit
MMTQGLRNNPIDRFSRRTNAVVEQSLLGLGILMIGVVAAQVFFRYVLNHSLFWSEELARYILVWLTFLGASVAYRRGVHPRIDLFVSRFGTRGARAIHVGTHLVAMAFFSVLVIYGAQFAYFVRLQISPALQIPKWIVMLVLPISGMVMILHALAAIVSEPREHAS